jgi:ER-bound oxygenase mpaB/B'/Rubber oxygenase, catalytic domain
MELCVNTLPSTLALLRVCSSGRIALQLDALSGGTPLQWIAHLQRQGTLQIPTGISPLRELRLENEDCLYVLSTMLLEQFRWNSTPSSEQERASIFQAWCDLGRSMNIADIPCTLEDMRSFCAIYECLNCYYTDCSRHVGRSTLDFLIGRLPLLLRPLGWAGIRALLPRRIRDALGLPHPPASWCEAFATHMQRYQHLKNREVRPGLSEHAQDMSSSEWLLTHCRSSDPVVFLLLALSFARYAPPIVIAPQDSQQRSLDAPVGWKLFQSKVSAHHWEQSSSVSLMSN